MWGVDELVACLHVFLLPVSLYEMPHEGALGVPEHQTSPSAFIQAEQIQVLPYSPVISAGQK